MSVKAILQQFDKIEAASGRNAKVALVREIADKHPDMLREIVKYAVYPMWVYRTGAPNGFMPSVAYEMEETLSSSAWFSFRATLSDLRDRSVTMFDGKQALDCLFRKLDTLHFKWFSRIINRDLKMGFQDWNKFFPGMIPAEPVMLCDKWDGENLTGEWIAEPKLDGLRAAVVIDGDGNCTAISRGNKEFWNWDHIASEIKSLGLRNVTLDGEFYAGNFGLSLSITKSQRPHPEASKLKYWIFDVIMAKDWNELRCPLTTKQRKQTLKTIFATARDLGLTVNHLVEVEGIQVTSVEEIEQAAQVYYDRGFEGSVLKRMDAPYVWDRSSTWLKIKPEEDADLTIVGANLGQGRHSSRLGALVVEGTVTYKKKQFFVRSNVGGGLSDSVRDHLWNEFVEGRLEGKTVEVTFQDVTSEVTLTEGVPSLRFPKFKRMRPDKDRA